MSAYVARHPLATPLFQLAAVLHLAAHRVRAMAMRLNAYLERRRAAAAALLVLQAMSERELRDIGLTCFDVQRAAWGGSLVAPDRNRTVQPDQLETLGY
jgi:uncharacterized protein YjiS (DUF1127 family)